MPTTNRELNLVFEGYLKDRVEQARAITPGQKKDLIAQLRWELNFEGRVPLLGGPIRTNVKHPAIRAALRIENK